LLAPAQALANFGRLVANASTVPHAPARGRPDRLVASLGRLFVRPRGRGGDQTGPNPTDRRKPGSKHHLITDAQGVPLAVTLTGANAHDVTQLLPLVDAIAPVAGKVGRPVRRPLRVQGDRAYGSKRHRL